MNGGTTAARPAGGDGRFVTLDGMRGVAALAVALFHFIGDVVPHGYVAVDFFFALSGFVLARAYYPRWKAGLGVGTFMLQRVARLYPLFLLGAVLSAGGAVLKLWAGGENIMKPASIAVALLFSWGMLPSPTGVALFPLNVPSWSLFFELLANLAMVLVLFRLPRWALLGVALAAAAWFVPIMLDRGSANVGALKGEWLVAMTRTAFSFSIGMLIAGLPAPAARKAGWGGTLCIAAIGLMLGLGIETEKDSTYDLFVILLASPLLVLIGSRVEPHRWLVPFATFTGTISYAVYAVHWPFIQIFRYGQFHLGISPLGMTPFFTGFVMLLSWAAVRWYDEPARRWLQAVMRPRAVPVGSGTPTGRAA